MLPSCPRTCPKYFSPKGGRLEGWKLGPRKGTRGSLRGSSFLDPRCLRGREKALQTWELGHETPEVPLQSTVALLMGRYDAGAHGPGTNPTKEAKAGASLIACMWDISGDRKRGGYQSGEGLIPLSPPDGHR